MWTREDPANVSRGVVDKELWDYGEKVAQDPRRDEIGETQCLHI
jgi:hypothetical protein